MPLMGQRKLQEQRRVQITAIIKHGQKRKANMMMVRILLAATVVILTAPAWAKSGTGFDALQRHDYATAYRIFRPLAEKGDAGAQYSLGLMYIKGFGVKKDLKMAGKWFRLAANQGQRYAKLMLGFVLDTQGKHAEAARIYRWAADQGRPAAQYRLGQMYVLGLGVPKDPREAGKLFRRAANQGYPEGQEKLGILLFEGVGVPKDRAAAVKLWLKAAAQEKRLSKQLLGRSYYSGEGVTQNFVEAAKWYRFAAQEGEAESQYMLGMLFIHGKGVPKDLVKAMMWHRLAEAQKDTRSTEVIKWLSANMTPEKIAEADRLVRQWRPKLSVSPHPKKGYLEFEFGVGGLRH